MEPRKRKVKIPCNHPLQYASMELEAKLIRQKKGTLGVPNECNVCFEEGGYVYYCPSCNFVAHEECIDLPHIINHPCHSRHPLKLVSTETIDYTDGKCHFCRSRRDQMYHCSICNFSIDMECWRIPPRLHIYQPKSHNHMFTLLPINVYFTCNACGMVGKRNPYLCLECGFMLHIYCIDLPRVININRHDHRISRTYHLGHGDWECGVCREKMDWTVGAFSCLLCPNYAVHSKCATRYDVWDGKELEDQPEDEEIEDPYKVINEKEIFHFSHEHNLRLGGDNVTDYENIRCDGCTSNQF